jgi:hypothetical protein
MLQNSTEVVQLDIYGFVSTLSTLRSHWRMASVYFHRQI